jgi:Flp pilus assembly protein TadB
MSKVAKQGKQTSKSNNPDSPANKGDGFSLPDITVLSLAVVFVVIAMYEIMAIGPSSGYWAVMLAMVCFFYYVIRKRGNR